MVKLSDYVTPVQAAKIIGCTKGRVYQMLRKGEIPGVLPITERSKLIPRKEAERISKSPADTGRPRKALAS